MIPIFCVLAVAFTFVGRAVLKTLDPPRRTPTPPATPFFTPTWPDKNRDPGMSSAAKHAASQWWRD